MPRAVKPRDWLLRPLVLLAALCGSAGLAQAPPPAPAPAHDAVRDATGPVFLVRMVGAIGPASADQFSRALDRAARQHAQLMVLHTRDAFRKDRAPAFAIGNNDALTEACLLYTSPSPRD